MAVMNTPCCRSQTHTLSLSLSSHTHSELILLGSYRTKCCQLFLTLPCLIDLDMAHKDGIAVVAHLLCLLESVVRLIHVHANGVSSHDALAHSLPHDPHYVTFTTALVPPVSRET